MRRLLLPVLTAALTLFPAVALAHPSFNPGEVAADTPTEAILVVPHGCSPEGGMPEPDGEALATIEVALQLVDGVTVEPGDVDGWDTAVEDGVVTWTDAGGATTDVIEFPVTISVAPDAGSDFGLSAFQQCEDDQFIRWTADSEDFPAVHLAVEGAGGGEDSHGSHDDASEPDDHATEPADHATDADDHATDDGMTDDGHGDMEMGEPLPRGAQALAGEQADSTAMIVTLAIAALVVLLLGGGLVALRRERP